MMARETGTEFSDQLWAERDRIAQYRGAWMTFDLAFLTVSSFGWKRLIDAASKSRIIRAAESKKEMVLEPHVVIDAEK